MSTFSYSGFHSHVILQMGRCIMGIAFTACTQRDDDYTKGNGHSTFSFSVVGMTRLWHCIRLKCVCDFETEMLPLLLKLVCNNYI